VLFSCTIEKRRYFDGYYVENGGMGKCENGKTGKRDPSTGSGTAHSTGSGTARSTGSGTGGNGEEGKRERGLGQQSAEHAPQKPHGVDIVTTEKKSDSQNVVVDFDNCLHVPNIELVIPNLDMMAPQTPARVSERLDSADTKVNWRQIVVEHQRQAECDFLYNKLINKRREPLLGTRISNFFLSGISAVVLGALLFGLGVYGNPFFKGVEILGILIGVTGIVLIVIAIIGFREIDRTKLRSTPKKFDMSSGDFRSF
jgi:hypothetical protein